jgi:VanZ family protein
MEACKPGKLRIFLATAYILLILLSSLIPMDENIRTFRFLLDLNPTIQNLLHIPAFAILSILCLQVLSYSPMVRIKKLGLVLVFSIVFGIVNELVQIAVPGRYPGLLDIGLNCIGATLGIILFAVAEQRHSGLLRRVVCG